jgi:UDP-N-acetylglucosamine--N-acetylmuramyl-(pentapeptide) pyrophosphoryl-undecaprenol N-acetylglucosamine transferase
MSAPHRRRIVFTGGGSAGHVVPSLPVIARLSSAGWSIDYIGSRGGPEAALIAAAGQPFHAIATGKLRRYFSLRNLTDVLRVLAGIWQSFWLLRRLAPDVVFSKGGFVAFPVVFAAWLNRIPVVAHESDLTPGLANRLSLPFCRVICTNFPDTRFPRVRARVVHTGTPIRAELLAGDPLRGRERLDAPPGVPILLVVGGSLGSERLNGVVREAISALDRWYVVHVCGPGRTEPARDLPGRYRQLEFVGAGWGDVLAAADVVVSRAGANALYELIALRKPHVLVPLSRAASRGDQIENARYAEQHGFSRVLAEEAATPAALVRAVAEVQDDRDAVIARLAAAGIADGTAGILAVIESATGPASGSASD